MNRNCYLKKLQLSNFRNHSYCELLLENRSVVITGNNGIGKTNILEAISLLGKSNGMKKVKVHEMQNRFSTEDWMIYYDFFNGTAYNAIKIMKRSNKKLIYIDGTKQSNYSELYSLSHVIWLIPQMDCILLSSPSERLKFLDRITILFKSNYAIYYLKYRKAKLERTKLLRDKISDEMWLTSIENIMAVNAINILHMRISVLKIIQEVIDQDATKLFPKASMRFSSQVKIYDSVACYQKHLKNNRTQDVLSGKTTFGIHNDHLQIFCQKRDLPIALCSTGEQKLLLLSIILSSIKARCIHYNSAPLLLLDDIMSHLDAHYRTALIEEILTLKCQTWITDVNQDYFDYYLHSFNFFKC
ncbi:DNA replication/repair protein RecF [Wolbachia endosymbiont of Howardula sp.]|uniref:DNA replication/repair protein RecF n=1 Tax=Wolbachia endosymbiont of Howardula sp. TaxID=2916816 RepID=UPI00217E962B|nr:DNA replication/repair protein RecF [Wolbachia endosymbiont of Howardula sp.]UWI83281.1 DNA replication/repair protein RecF [Wolbachia endosymbiont of Howardula sp.]